MLYCVCHGTQFTDKTIVFINIYTFIVLSKTLTDSIFLFYILLYYTYSTFLLYWYWYYLLPQFITLKLEARAERRKYQDWCRKQQIKRRHC